MGSSTERNPDFAINTRISSAAIMRIFTMSAEWRRLKTKAEEDKNSLGLRHTRPWYRRSVPKSTKWCRAVQPPGTSRPERLPRPSALPDLPA